MESLSEREFEILIKEYEILQKAIRDFDARLFQIKGWSIAIYSTATGLALLNNRPILLLVPLISSIIFWGLDAMYKNFQYVCINRTRKVESALNGDIKIDKYAYISSEFINKEGTFIFKFKKGFKKLFFFNVMFLYLAKIFVLCILLLIAF